MSEIVTTNGDAGADLSPRNIPDRANHKDYSAVVDVARSRHSSELTIERSEDLLNWTPFAGLEGLNGSTVITDSTAVERTGFYRVRVVSILLTTGVRQRFRVLGSLDGGKSLPLPRSHRFILWRGELHEPALVTKKPKVPDSQ
jgi:hypothetical protein